ncbi:AAA domain-containing protein [Spirosoma jeollabukense]
MKIPLQTVLKTFRRRLTNLSSRNRSLLLTSLPAGQFLDLHETDFLLNKPSFTIIADLIARKPSVALCEVLDPRQERSNEVSRKLRKIDRTARFIEEERGTEDLYVGWPFVKGKFLDDTTVHGPLLFFPVKIEQQGKFWKLVRRGDELAFLNPTLALAYGQFNQVKLPDDLIEKTMDDLDRDSLVFRTQLYEWLKSSPLEINFNQDLFVDKLQFFTRQTTKDLSQLERTGELKLYPEAVLGIFPQAGSFLVPDYDALIAKGEGQGAEGERPEVETDLSDDTLLNLYPLPPALRPLPEKNIHTPLLMDASQELALRAVKAGQSLVVQGPPGTGKSQLIANLMADAAASGKRVLLVCQKRAALDVVQERLEQVGMGPFMALIHDFQDDRRALYDQIASQIDQVDAYRQQNNSLNAVLLERDFEIESKRIDETVTVLQSFKDALFDTSECGLSAKELYLISEPGKPTIPLEDIYAQFPLNNVDNFVRRISDYVAYQHRLGSDHPWNDRISFAPFVTTDLTKAIQIINGLIQLRNDANGQTAAFLGGQPLALAELVDWQAHDWELTALLNLLTVDDTDTLWKVIMMFRNNPDHPAFKTEETQLEKLAQTWDDALVPPGPELSLQSIELSPFRELLADALAARPSWVTWNWWQLTKSGKAQLQDVATANGLVLSEHDLQTLTVKVAKRIQLEGVQQQSATLLSDLSLPNSPDSVRLVQQAQHITERLNTLQLVCQLPESCWQTSKKFLEVVTNLLRVAAAVEKQRIDAQTYLTTDQIGQLWKDDVYTDNLRRTLSSDFDLLVEADRIQENFSEFERTVIARLGNHEPLRWVETFQESIHRAWLDHIETKYPELRSVSSLRMSQWEQTLQESVQRKQVLSRDILLVKLREQTYRNLVLNRLSNVVTYRDLLHQTSKKRNVWPVRKLMESFADEVFKLVPCWLASPESVSAMFPLREGLFDLVIFDEASQCFAENGIPAMVRGKQVVITGDNQQLRPSDLYRIRIDENELAEETPIALEVESLLELAAQELPQVSLNEHYRSRSLDLITFSNEHFYQNKLLLLPHFEVVNQQEPAIRYLNVKGTWLRNTNLAEAEAIVHLIDQLPTELPGRSVGIVTFNYPQQQLIQDMLEDRFASESVSDENKSELPSGLFVKNIENVQGDERDIIIFSIGYAPDERGKLSMQFGSLNARGGENRLNVAVTRARERVYVVTSLWPDQLTIADTANEGPKLLKAYLAYALNVAQQQFRPAQRFQQIIPFGTLLKNKLSDQHPDWQPELPFADLTIKIDNTYKSLVLTDDDAYYQQTLKQTHAYLPIALQDRKWPFQRVWSREYWRGTSKKA